MIQRTRCDEKCPSVEFLAQLRQTFQVKHLPDGYTPSRKTIVMHRPFVVAVGSYFERNSIPGDGYDMVLPHESSHRFTLDKAAMPVLVCLRLSSIILLLFEGKRLPGFREAATQKEDVAVLEGDVALLSDFFHLFQGDSMANHAVGLKTSLLCIRNVIDEYTASSNTVLRPVSDANTIAFTLTDFIRGRATVPSARSVAHVGAVVTEAIPLRRRLRVETPDVVPGNPFIIRYRHYLVLTWKPVEALPSRKSQ